MLPQSSRGILYNKGYEVACLDGAVELYAESITLEEKLMMYNFISEVAHKQDSSDSTLTKRDFLDLSFALISESMVQVLNEYSHR